MGGDFSPLMTGSMLARRGRTSIQRTQKILASVLAQLRKSRRCRLRLQLKVLLTPNEKSAKSFRLLRVIRRRPSGVFGPLLSPPWFGQRPLSPTPYRRDGGSTLNYLFGIEISCLTSVGQAGHQIYTVSVQRILVADKPLHVSVIGAPSHPFRLRRQVPFIRVAGPYQP